MRWSWHGVVAVILAVEDYESLMETLEVLSDPRARADIRQAEAEMAGGEVYDETEVRLSGGHSEIARTDRVRMIQIALREKLRAGHTDLTELRREQGMRRAMPTRSWVLENVQRDAQAIKGAYNDK